MPGKRNLSACSKEAPTTPAKRTSATAFELASSGIKVRSQKDEKLLNARVQRIRREKFNDLGEVACSIRTVDGLTLCRRLIEEKGDEILGASRLSDAYISELRAKYKDVGSRAVTYDSGEGVEKICKELAGAFKIKDHPNTSKRSRDPLHKFFLDYEGDVSRSDVVSLYIDLAPLRVDVPKNADTLSRFGKFLVRRELDERYAEEFQENVGLFDRALAADALSKKKEGSPMDLWWVRYRSLAAKVVNPESVERAMRAAPDWQTCATDLREILKTELGQALFRNAKQVLEFTHASDYVKDTVETVLRGVPCVGKATLQDVRKRCRIWAGRNGIVPEAVNPRTVNLVYRNGFEYGSEVSSFDDLVEAVLWNRIKKGTSGISLAELNIEEGVFGQPDPSLTLQVDAEVMLYAGTARATFNKMLDLDKWTDGESLLSKLNAKKNTVAGDDPSFKLVECGIISALAGEPGERFFDSMILNALPQASRPISLEDSMGTLSELQASTFSRIVSPDAVTRLGKVMECVSCIKQGIPPAQSVMACSPFMLTVSQRFEYFLTQAHLSMLQESSPCAIAEVSGKALLEPFFKVATDQHGAGEIDPELINKVSGFAYLMAAEQKAQLKVFQKAAWEVARTTTCAGGTTTPGTHASASARKDNKMSSCREEASNINSFFNQFM